MYIVASDELFAFRPDFSLIGSWRNPYLKHCHETSVHQRTLYIASTGFDSIIGFDLDDQTFTWAMHVDLQRFRFKGERYDPDGDDGPLLLRTGNVCVRKSLGFRKSLGSAQPTVYIATITDREHRDQLFAVYDLVEDTIAPHPQTVGTRCAREFLGSLRSGNCA